MSNRRWRYDEQGGTEETNVVVELTDSEILDQYYEYWKTQMTKVGKADQISPEACIEDFVVVNWAWEVKDLKRRFKNDSSVGNRVVHLGLSRRGDLFLIALPLNAWRD